ncbi:hypothetical protein AB0J72_45245 [Dactylosporangium sp. NPDC049742]|uniref:hypothetical protein n=1 Tax=Dactylosporangium sp. NPDC049742 TaxID=3154737 RepID=UPI0034472B67
MSDRFTGWTTEGGDRLAGATSCSLARHADHRRVVTLERMCGVPVKPDTPLVTGRGGRDDLAVVAVGDVRGDHRARRGGYQAQQKIGLTAEHVVRQVVDTPPVAADSTFVGADRRADVLQHHRRLVAADRDQRAPIAHARPLSLSMIRFTGL